MRYIDTGGRDPAHALGTWLEAAVLNDSTLTELRWQSGYFGGEILPFVTPALRRLRISRGTVSVLVGSNDGITRQADLAALLAAAGSPRPGLKVGVVSFGNGYFHPKTVHLMRGDGSAAAYVGSANLTGAGSALNVEAGIILDTREGDDRGVLDAVSSAIEFWFAGPRPGLNLVSTLADLAALSRGGILDVPQPSRPRPPASAGGASASRPALRPLLTLPVTTPPPPRPTSSSSTVLASWTKKLSASDAQRKGTGNQRGSITLVQAKAPIDPKTYFRRVLFARASWTRGTSVTGQPLETAKVRFDVTLLGRSLGLVVMEISYARNRESAQSNYTSLLHIGPLASQFAARDMTGRQLTLEQRGNGTFGLVIR